MFLLASMFGVVTAHVGVWSSRPLWTPSCVNGAFPGTEQDPTRTFCCQDRNPACIDKFQHTQPNPKALPPYTTDSRRDHHHVGDGPIIGNGNIGVSIGRCNLVRLLYDVGYAAPLSHLEQSSNCLHAAETDGIFRTIGWISSIPQM